MPDAQSYEMSAALYDRLYAFKDYDAINRHLRDTLEALHPTARSVLDVGCGTGIHLQSLATHYEVEGSDLSAQMLEVARQRCPGTPLHQADMTELALPRQFDVVLCLFSAVGYVRTPDRLRAAIATFARHLTPGGLLLVEPWFTPESYWSGRLTVNHLDDDDLKVTWMYVAERQDDRSIFDIHYLVGTDTGVEHFTERHEMGLFTHAEYLDAFTSAGLEVEHEREGFFGRGLYRGVAPRDASPVRPDGRSPRGT